MIFRIPDHDDVLVRIGEGVKHSYKDELNVLVWNVYKGQRGSHFREDFKQLAAGMDFILIQEALMDEHMPKLWKENFKDYHWSMAQSFKYRKNDHTTGVCIGSRYTPDKLEYIRAKSRELWWFTPKISLLSEYDFSGVKVLFVCTHMLNFVRTKVFLHAMNEIAEKIAAFDGPVVLAGDFNTWNVQRYLAMKEMFHDLKLEHVDFDQDWRLIRLDHVFVRGFSVQKAKVHHAVESSDHFPLELTLKFA